MLFKTVIKGQYLGFCEQKGYIYSVFLGFEKDGSHIFGIYAVKGNQIEELISYTVEPIKEKVNS